MDMMHFIPTQPEITIQQMDSEHFIPTQQDMTIQQMELMHFIPTQQDKRIQQMDTGYFGGDSKHKGWTRQYSKWGGGGGGGGGKKKKKRIPSTFFQHNRKLQYSKWRANTLLKHNRI